MSPTQQPRTQLAQGDPDEVAVHGGGVRLTRRGVLVLGGLGVAGLAGLGWGASQLLPDAAQGTLTPEGRERPPADSVDRATLTAMARLGQARLTYEPTARAATYWASAAFVTRLQAWLVDYTALTGARPDTLRSYGAWVGGSGHLWHGAGRAFDIAGVNRGASVLASCRYDTWRTEAAASVARRQREYWRLAATLHLHFADVLTYLFDADHSNHIHVDTGRFGEAGTPRFLQRSAVQTQSVQAMLTHVWGVGGIETSGDYDSDTRDAATRVLADSGFDGELHDGTEAWAAFMRATARHG